MYVLKNGTFISTAHNLPKDFALLSIFHPDICISYGISDVDLTDNDVNIVINVYHHMILHIATNSSCMQICLCSLSHISQ